MGCGTSNPSVNVSEKSMSTKKIIPSRTTRPQPQVDNVENFVVVWLDPAIGSNTDTQKSKDQLQQLVNSVKLFTNAEECRSFINSVKDEKIFLIVSGTLGEQFVPTVQEATQIDSIYIFCSDKDKHKRWADNYPEVRGLYTSIKPLCEQLGKDMKRSDRDLVGFAVVSSGTNFFHPKSDPESFET